MIICSHSNIDIIQGVIGYGDAEGITDWRISNTSSGILNIFNSTFTNAIVTILENSNVGIGITNPSSVLDINGDANITGVYKKNNRDIINDTSNYVLSTSNIIVPRILTEVGNGSNYVSRLTTDVNTRVDNTSNYVLATSNILVNRIVSSASGGGGSSSQWTNVSSGIYYNTSNVGIGTINPISKLHIYDETIQNIKLTIQNNMPIILPPDITIAGTTLTTIGSSKCITFPYSGAGTTKTYTLTTPETLFCDILVVAGGGGGGSDRGGGGGAGGVIYTQNITLNGTYNIIVGKEGLGGTSGSYGGTGTQGANGNNSSISGSGITTITTIGGGGGGGCAPGVIRNGLSGGSGGGGSQYNGGGSGGTGTSGQGNNGGIGYESGAAGGGGGVMAVGTNASSTNAGNGGVGLSNTITGTPIIYGSGGGGGGCFGGGGTNQPAGTGGSSGAGTGGNLNAGGANATIYGCGGGGAGSAGSVTTKGGNGFSGVVIIRYRNVSVPVSVSSSLELLRGSASDINMDYKLGNYNGEFKVISSTSAVDTDYIRITSTGAIFNPTGSSVWSTTSDRRIKENIEEASYDKCYDNINNLGLYRFNYIDGFNNVNKDIKQLGFIAQEVKDIFPKAVVSQSFNNDELNIPDLLTIDISQINYSLYGAVKKLIEMYNDDELRLKNLERLLNINNTSSNIAIDTSNIAIDTSNISLDTSNLPIDTSNISIDTSNISIDTSNIALDTSNISIDTSNISIDTSNISIDTSNISIDTSNTLPTTSNLPIDTSNIAIDTSNTLPTTSNLPIDTSNITIDTSNITIDTSNIDQTTSNLNSNTNNIPTE